MNSTLRPKYRPTKLSCIGLTLSEMSSAILGTTADKADQSCVSFRDLQRTLEDLGSPLAPLPVLIATAPTPTVTTLCGEPDQNCPSKTSNDFTTARTASEPPSFAWQSHLTTWESRCLIPSPLEPIKTAHSNLLNTSLDLRTSQTSRSSQSNQPQKGPLTLVIFSNDFGHILKYCLNPAKEPMAYYDARVGPDTRQLLRLIDRNRIRILRKEQKIKKIVNYAFRILLKKFLLEKYGPISHVSDNMKREFHKHYFGHLETDPPKAGPPNRPSKASTFSFTYNRSFFAKIRKCEAFMADFKVMISQIRDSIVTTIRTDLRRFLGHIERFMLYDRPELDKWVALEQFFDLRNKDNRKQGIKIPWTKAQHGESVQCVMEEAGLKTLIFDV